jgi:predicted nucleic acid-binding protein
VFFVLINVRGLALDFDGPAAAAAARLAADRKSAGRSADFRNTLIAGIAQARHATIATRNTRHVAGLDIPVVDPWTASRSRVV